VVTATGLSTELGRISRLVEEAVEGVDLQLQPEEFFPAGQVRHRFTGLAPADQLADRRRAGRQRAVLILRLERGAEWLTVRGTLPPAPVLRDEARTQGKTLADHCAHLVVHGMLHLQGYDHGTAREARVMEARETALLAQLGVSDPYRRAGTASAALER